MKVKDQQDRQSVTINDVYIKADEFAWDGCHKIYIVTDQKSRDELEGYGYDFYPIDELVGAWNASCLLRFISDASLSQTYVSQGYEDGTKTVRIQT